VPRLTIPIPGVREFQSRYETAVPDLPVEAVRDLVSRRARWSEMVALIERSAPHGFLIYFRNDVHPVMELAGDGADCVAYLMGNHTIAERMGIPEIAQVGIELDDKLASLLDALAVPVPHELRE
jgi:hypothetical protein